MSDYEVYGLYTLSELGEKQYFYVGRTERGVQKRLTEHRLKVAKGHTDLYVYLRENEAQGISCHVDVLRVCRGEEYAPDAERWEVIRLLRAGHDLRNMRYGDRLAREDLVRQVGTPWIRSAQDVAIAKSVAEKRKTKRESRQLQRKELKRMLKKEGIANVSKCLLLPTAIRRRLTYRHSDVSVAKGLKFEELVQMARRYKALDEIRERLAEAAMRPSTE